MTPFAIVTSDSVDQDDLHPYDVLNRVRQDVTAAVVLTQERQTKQTLKPKLTKVRHVFTGTRKESQDKSKNDEELVVVMQRATFIKVYRPEFEMADQALLELYERITKWPDVMMQSIRDILTAQSM